MTPRSSSVRTLSRKRLATLVVAGALAAGSAGIAAVAAGSASAATYNRYVGLGDSFASAPGVPMPTGNPICGRSSQNYAHQVAGALKPAQFVDVSCGGAVTGDMTGKQFGSVPAQFDALTADTDLVTLSISGNDIGFGEITATCGLMDAANPTAPLCTQYWNPGGMDRVQQRIDATAPKVAAVLRGINERAPQARVVVVGYLDLLPTDGTKCWPLVPISSGDLPYLDAKNRALNTMLRETALANGASYADTYTPSVGHDMCRMPGVKYVEGLLPTGAAAPVHPNLAGTKTQAEQVLKAL